MLPHEKALEIQGQPARPTPRPAAAGRTARQASSAGEAKPTTVPSSPPPPQVLADFHPTPEQLAKARKWLIRALAERAVERLKGHDPS